MRAMVYTDGSVDSLVTGRASCAFVLSDWYNHKIVSIGAYFLEECNDVLKAEAQGLIFGLKAILNSKEPIESAFLMSDNRGLVHTIYKADLIGGSRDFVPRKDQRLGEELKLINELFTELQNRHIDVSLTWVRGHSKDTGNLLCDQLAVDARKKGLSYVRV